MQPPPPDFPPAPPGRAGFPWTQAVAPPPAAAAYPRISVITPSYQQGMYLEETIRSVLLQGFPNLDYIVIDGGSTDQSRQIIEKYTPYLTYWVSEPDSGQTNAINKGLARASGDVMGWLNSDDVLLPGALLHIGRCFATQPQTMLVCGFRKVIDSHSQFVVNWFKWPPQTAFLQSEGCVPQETVYWRRTVWEAAGPLDESFRYAMDYEYWQRLLSRGYHFTLLPRYLGCIRWHAESKGTLWDDVRDSEQTAIYQKYGIGQTRAEALDRLDRLYGPRWQEIYQIMKDLGHFRLSNSPRALLFIFRLLHTPLVGPLLLRLYRLYRKVRRPC